ncbi:hypothetical protein, partial [Mycobacterium tuberculosis]|uniref:hypothetical protein n=1 Tax=Mycobacterium tuberculosis TaxID=1773 RepID=UPI001BE0EBD0
LLLIHDGTSIVSKYNLSSGDTVYVLLGKVNDQDLKEVTVKNSKVNYTKELPVTKGHYFDVGVSENFPYNYKLVR